MTLKVSKNFFKEPSEVRALILCAQRDEIVNYREMPFKISITEATNSDGSAFSYDMFDKDGHTITKIDLLAYGPAPLQQYYFDSPNLFFTAHYSIHPASKCYELALHFADGKTSQFKLNFMDTRALYLESDAYKSASNAEKSTFFEENHSVRTSSCQLY